MIIQRVVSTIALDRTLSFIGYVASARHRKSPYPVIDMQEALTLIFEHSQRLPVEERKVDASLRGCILAEDVLASTDIPPHPTTNVDGYAVHSENGTGTYPVLTSKSCPLPLQDGKTLADGRVFRVNTGGPIPAGADAVVMVEDTEVAATDGNEEAEVSIQKAARPGDHVRKVGSDVKAGELVLHAGTLISESGGELGTLCFVGKKTVRTRVQLHASSSSPDQVKVYRRPIVAILSTGNEISDIHTSSDASSLIYDTNRPSLGLALEAAGYDTIDLGIARDEAQATEEALHRGLSQADVVIATGGTSMGEVDLLKPVIERQMGGSIWFGRVAMKPGCVFTCSVP